MGHLQHILSCLAYSLTLIFGTVSTIKADTFRGETLIDLHTRHLGNGWFLSVRGKPGDPAGCVIFKDFSPIQNGETGANSIFVSIATMDVKPYDDPVYFMILGSSEWTTTKSRKYSVTYHLKINGIDPSKITPIKTIAVSVAPGTISIPLPFPHLSLAALYAANSIEFRVNDTNVGEFTMLGGRNAIDKIKKCRQAVQAGIIIPDTF